MNVIAANLVKNIRDNIKDDKMKLPKLLSSIAATAVLAFASVLPAEAAITTFFSAGTNCTGATNTTFTTSGPAVKVSLCATTTVANEGVCGHTTYLSSAGGALQDNRFMVTARASGTAFTDNINSTVNVLVAAPTSGNVDFGALANPLAPATAPATLLLQTFDLTPQANATAGSYIISTGAGSILAVDTTGAVDCSGIAGVSSAGATFTLNLFVAPTAPVFTSVLPAPAATVNAAYAGYTFTASGNPAPTFSVTTGAVPAGMALSAAGVLSGMPTAGAPTTNFTVTATNTAGTASQAVTLTVNPASQTLTFNAQVPAAQLFSAGTFAINPVATSAAPNSGNAIIYSSTTTGVCTVSGTTVTIVTAGTCTIAANQAATANYTAAAQVTQSVTINASAPAQPVAPIGSAGNANGTVTITAPNNGGSVITGYTVTCSPAGGADTQAGSPALSHLISPLANGTPYTCTVVATNLIGSSPASPPSNAFTPSLAPVAPSFTSAATLGGLTVGVAMAQFNITASGVPTPTITGGAAPAGLVFTSGGASSGTGNVTGTPTAAGTFNLALTAASTTAPNANQTLVITIAKGTRTINFTDPADRAFSATPVALVATTTPAGGTVIFTTTTPTICSVSGTNATMITVGNCVIEANAATDANYLVSPMVSQNFNITQATQTITFGAQSDPRGFSTTPVAISPLATASSGLAVTYTAGGSCTVSGNSFTTTALGLCTITANQAGNAQFSAAAPVPRSFTIVQGANTISFFGLSSQSLGTAPFVIGATASSGLAVTFISTTPTTCTTSGTNGSTVTVLIVGSCTIQANQAGNGTTFGAAAPVSASFQIVPPGGQTVTSSNNPAPFRSQVILTSTITGTNPTGTVTFSVVTSNGLVKLCESVPVASSTASCAIPASLMVSNSVTVSVSYSGDGTNPPTTTTFSQLVNTLASSLSAVTFPIQPNVGASVVIKATVTAANLASTVAFNENGTALPGCGAVLIAPLPGATNIGVASCTVPAITAGLHNYVVTYNHFSGGGFEQVVVPLTPVVGAADFTDMWWAGASENGWGLSITQHARAQFIVLFVYDAFGKPIWYVLPQGTWNASNTAFTGALYQPTSSPLSSYNTAAFMPGAAIGTATVTYTGSGTATLTYTINGVSGSKSIVRQPFGTDDSQAKMQVGDMWWAGIGQNGWGMNIAQHHRVIFPVWYTYDNMGRTVFYTVPVGSWSGSVFSGDIYETVSSPWLGVNYNPAQFVVTKAGTMTLDFADQSNAVMTYTLNGLTQQKVIMRQPYP